MGARIVLFTFGSLGDLLPYVAIARELNARRHRAAIGTSENHRESVEREGIEFIAVRPSLERLMEEQPGIMARVMDARRGSEVVVRELFAPHVRESFEDTQAAARGADLIVSHPLTFTVPMVARLQRVHWASTLLAPTTFFSVRDPTVPPNAPWLESLRFLGPAFHAPFRWLAEAQTRPWLESVDDLRAELGLPRGQHPLFAGAHSPESVLALFSGVLASPQRDWPPATRATGFPFLDTPVSAALPTELSAFLDAGDPPIVFTPGSSAVHDAGAFYLNGANASGVLRRRAVLLIGRETDNRPKMPLPPSVFVAEYAPYASLFARAAAIVHQGGIGTTGEALRAGRPMLVMPYSHDQFDNAARVARLGVALRIARAKFSAASAAAALRRLLEEPRFAQRAAQIGERVRSENGARAACDAMEELLGRGR